MSTFEERVQAKMDTIRAQKEQDTIEIEARRRLNAEKRKQKAQAKQAQAKQAQAKQAQAKQAARKAAEETPEERDRRYTITGLKARIKRLEYDVEHEAYTYKRIMEYRNNTSLSPIERMVIDNILMDVQKTHHRYLGTLAVKTQKLTSI
jgi:hypothetical protein